MRKRFRCLVGKHDWQMRHNDDNEPYSECKFCSAVQGGLPEAPRGGGIPPGAIPAL